MAIRVVLNLCPNSARRCWMNLKCAGNSQGVHQLTGRTISFWSWLCAPRHCHDEKDPPPNKCGSPVFFIMRYDSWERHCFQALLSFNIIFPTLKSNPSFVQRTGTTLSYQPPSSGVSSHTRLRWCSAMPNKLQ